MKKYYVFDVDGTITPPRKPLEKKLENTFKTFCKNNNVVLVSGSSLSMIKEQIPESIQEHITMYGCNGVEGISFNTDHEINDEELIKRLNVHLQLSTFDLKLGNHIEQRNGMINFSVIGRNASDEQRKLYSDYDKEYNERSFIVNDLQKKFPKYEFKIGGEISIDITKLGIDKSLVIKDIILKESQIPEFCFFGDKPNGNDYGICKYIEENNLGTWKLLTHNDFFKMFFPVIPC